MKKAEAGDAEAQFALSMYYYCGDRMPNGVTQDYKEAVKWLTKSAEQGNAYAQMMLGSCYVEGNGITKNEKEAVKWFTKSAEQGNVLGQTALGACYHDGAGVTQDYKEAVKWWTKAAEQGGEDAKKALEEIKSE